MIKIVNFPFCNYSSVARMLIVQGFQFEAINTECSLNLTDTLILPGVGSFEQGINYLHSISLINSIRNHAENGGKIIGICLGLQLLFNASDESPGIDGLGVISGRVHELVSSSHFHVPHIGWNSILSTVNTPESLSSFFQNNGESISDFYFVHSYYALAVSDKYSIAVISGSGNYIDIAFKCNNVYAFQFHPEKSGPAGYKLFKAVLEA